MRKEWPRANVPLLVADLCFLSGAGWSRLGTTSSANSRCFGQPVVNDKTPAVPRLEGAGGRAIVASHEELKYGIRAQELDWHGFVL